MNPFVIASGGFKTNEMKRFAAAILKPERSNPPSETKRVSTECRWNSTVLAKSYFGYR
jgi:hypothetical protein